MLSVALAYQFLIVLVLYSPGLVVVAGLIMETVIAAVALLRRRVTGYAGATLLLGFELAALCGYPPLPRVRQLDLARSLLSVDLLVVITEFVVLAANGRVRRVGVDNQPAP